MTQGKDGNGNNHLLENEQYVLSYSRGLRKVRRFQLTLTYIP